MKYLKRIDEAVGTINERRASAEALLKAVIKGDTTEVEGIALSKQMAQGFLDWLQYSTYGKKFGALPFYKLFSASFSWGLDRYVKGANTEVKGEFKELKAKAKSMKEANELNEGMSPLNIANAAVLKADVPLSYAKDYIDSLTRMSKRDKKKFKEYDNFTEDDFIEDVEYNMANESVNEASFDSEELYSEIEKDRKTKMISDIEDGSILFYHKDIAKGKAEVNVDGWSGDITIEVPGGPYGSGEWYGDQVSNMKDIDKQIKSYIKAEKSGEFEDMKESAVTEARFVKDFDEAVLNATTKKEVEKIYPKAKFFVGKLTHFFGELDNNLFFRAHYAGKKDGSFKIKSVYSKKGSNYVHLFNELGESVVNESSGSEERRIALRAMKSIAKYLNRDLRTSAQYLINAAEDVQRDIEKGKVK